MKTITLNIEDDAYKSILNFINFRKITGNDIGPDYQFIIAILFGIHTDEPDVTITKDWLDK